MATDLQKEQTVSVHELLLSQAYEINALVNVLEKKGILTKKEILDEIRRLNSQ